MMGANPRPVIPGRAGGANLESRYKPGIYFWIPGSLASRAPRNDSREIVE
jgi:hypothetical protein